MLLQRIMCGLASTASRRIAVRRLGGMFLLFTLCVTAMPSMAQVVHFGLPDYAELGYIRDAVKPGYEELSNAKLNSQASLKLSDLALQSITSAGGLTGISNALTGLAEFASNVSTINGATDAKSVNDLASLFSPFDTSPITTSLASLQASLSTLNSQIWNPIEAPTLWSYYATAVSGEARKQARDLSSVAESGRNSLQIATGNLATFDATLTAYSAQLDKAASINHDLTRKLWELVATPLIGYHLIYPLLLNSISAEADIQSLRNQVAKTLTQVKTTTDIVSQRTLESNDLINGLDYALSSTPLPSQWTTRCDVGPSDPRYALSFTGRSFTSPYTEIDGNFLLGHLSVHNFITLGAGDTIVTNTLTFEAERWVDDPILGPKGTIGAVDFNMSYFATLNTDDPAASADYFSVPGLGINIHIFEENTLSLDIYGSYHSPLRISAIRITPGSTGGFITQINPVPEPGIALTGAVFVGAVALCTIRRRRQRKY